jgi:hypothetical protein
MPNGTISDDPSSGYSTALLIPVVDPAAPAGSRNRKLAAAALAAQSALDAEVAARIAADTDIIAVQADTIAVLGDTIEMVAALTAADASNIAGAIANLVAFDVAAAASDAAINATLAIVVDDLNAANAAQDAAAIANAVAFADVDAAIAASVAAAAADLAASDAANAAALSAAVADLVTADETVTTVLDAVVDPILGGTTGQILEKASGTDFDYAWVAKRYQLKVAVGGTPEADEWLGGDAVAVALSLPADFAGSFAHCAAAPTDTYVISVKKNGTEIGTITFAAAATTGTFATSGGTAQSATGGDRIELVGQTTPDATIANVYLTIAGTYV